jgi:DNA polymerase-1
MDKGELLNLLDDLQEEKEIPTKRKHDRVLLIDGLNLFFRNFSILKMVNPDGVHIGGLGGFLRSLGAMIRKTDPTSVYVVFDGPGSSDNRKNLIPEYKSGRHTQRVTKWDGFDNLEEEDASKIDQITRVIHYLKLLPIKTSILSKVEADDIIAYYCDKLPKSHNSQMFIVSSDKDFLQLVNNKVTVYRPMEKEFYNPAVIANKFEGLLPENFILYKTLLGDSSDKIQGIKGLGKKGIFKKFPELKEKPLTLDDIFDISEAKLKEHVVYARVLQQQSQLETSYKVMDLSNPMIDDKGIEYLNNLVEEELPDLNDDIFVKMYNEDQLGGMIRNVEFWLKDIFEKFKSYKD